MAYLLTRDWGTAEDLVQTALAKAWVAWRRIEGNPDPYVYRIIVNTHATWWRRLWRGVARCRSKPCPRRPTRRTTRPPWGTRRRCGRPSPPCRPVSGR
ncbi:sigma factor [Nonomuraea sp. NPDC049655]|uniref:sigma factor n=1 Tax=Nonomuraea sp. NPDC049655 TaxID=3364355 RepID=UPI0037B47E29